MEKMMFQFYNKRINAWVKAERMENGRVRIKNVKQQKPNVAFKGVPKKKR